MKMYQSILLLTLILIMLMMISFLISKKSILDLNKTSPFECGFSKMTSPRMSFSIQFFMIAIIFLMFDIELTIILPIINSIKMMKIYEWLKSSLIITTIITYGLLHEWFNGMIEWSK
uniref:NADH-ubiquinone oxidoreductase chain 3 n=1 Tax=Epeurysa nawaii TaxID=1308479 RepID=A0A7S5DCM6_9HEMI|nr:NADH dehydrogenase subunit 3 [Epeurysa nawaii]QBZ37997.1 NADH dehydrogenase subunit 3 [Epeurysa nawaii]QBZ38010.1 NADH dehydrogenase subunit 3 [Epeurysa nawaii]